MSGEVLKLLRQLTEETDFEKRKHETQKSKENTAWSSEKFQKISGGKGRRRESEKNEENGRDSCQIPWVDVLERGALPLLYLARRANQEVGTGVKGEEMKETKRGQTETSETSERSENSEARRRALLPKGNEDLLPRENVGELSSESSESSSRASALLCIRLLAQQLQLLAMQNEANEGKEGDGSAESPEKDVTSQCPVKAKAAKAATSNASLNALPASAASLSDLALSLAHWVSTSWCSPRIEVVAA